MRVFSRCPQFRKYKHVCARITFERPVKGNLSQDSSCSSPFIPSCCPAHIRPPVAVDTPIPSPRNMMTFLATPSCLAFKMVCILSWPWSYQNWGSTKIKITLLISLFNFITKNKKKRSSKNPPPFKKTKQTTT